ncbi:MAG: FprA family A-type flavoprotein [Desulfovibrionaceae bacterium]
MHPNSLTENIYWVGAVDYDERDFHGYSLSPRGTTYNAYIIKDTKVTLVDTVKDTKTETMLENIREVVNPEDIDYIVCNHLELDHAGALAKIVEIAKPEKIFCSLAGLKSLNGQFDTTDWNIQAVRDGEIISLGERTISFIDGLRIHWPDSMLSYIKEDGILFSNDVFGQNISSGIFADGVDRAMMTHAVKEYFYNIVLPFAKHVPKLLSNILKAVDTISIIAPDHGAIFRTQEDIEYILNLYKDLAEQKPKKKILIIYDTMWHTTEKMAYQVGKGIKECDPAIEVEILSVKSNHHSAIMTALADSGAIAFGSPTHNNTILPLMSAVLTYMKGLKPQNRVGACFGSFGWSGEATRVLTEALSEMRIPLVSEPVKMLYCLDEYGTESCIDLGRTLGKALLESIEKHKDSLNA